MMRGLSFGVIDEGIMALLCYDRAFGLSQVSFDHDAARVFLPFGQRTEDEVIESGKLIITHARDLVVRDEAMIEFYEIFPITIAAEEVTVKAEPNLSLRIKTTGLARVYVLGADDLEDGLGPGNRWQDFNEPPVAGAVSSAPIFASLTALAGLFEGAFVDLEHFEAEGNATGLLIGNRRDGDGRFLPFAMFENPGGAFQHEAPGNSSGLERILAFREADGSVRLDTKQASWCGPLATTASISVRYVPYGTR